MRLLRNPLQVYIFELIQCTNDHGLMVGNAKGDNGAKPGERVYPAYVPFEKSMRFMYVPCVIFIEMKKVATHSEDFWHSSWQRDSTTFPFGLFTKEAATKPVC